ncbi:MAG: insulinase family protein [Firmicutes bacterium]|nr:insulinase family protein [Bacillota bacterium]
MSTLSNTHLQETLHYCKLPQGLEVFVLPRPGFQKKYAVYSTKYGAIDSEFVDPSTGQRVKVPDGIAHFLEHKLFESEDRPVFDRFAELGAAANAYTSNTITSYLFSGTDMFTEALVTLLEFVQTPYLTDANVAKEKGIIEQELRMYADSPGRRVYSNLLQALYQKNPVRIEVGGTVESIYQITKEDLLLCYRTFYHPGNMALFVIGDVNPQAVVELAAAHVRQPENPLDQGIERIYPEEPDEINQERIIEEMVVSRPLVYLGLKDNSPGEGLELLRQTVVTNLLHKVVFGPTSSLYTELYEAGLIDDGFGAFYTAEPQYGFTMLGGETTDPEGLIEKIKGDLEDKLARGFDHDAFLRVKRQAIGEFLQAFDSLEFIANNYIRYHFRGTSLFDYLSVLEGITPEDGEQRLKQHFAPDNMAVSLVLPKGQ